MQSFFEEIKNFNKIVVGGNSASGKSTLAKIISKKQGLPLYSFDKIFWGPGWKRPDPGNLPFFRRPALDAGSRKPHNLYEIIVYMNHG